MHGVEVGELRLPQGASVSLVIRGGTSLVPERRTVLRSGDDLLVVTPRKLREATEDRLRQVSQNGRLAQWLGDPRRARPGLSPGSSLRAGGPAVGRVRLGDHRLHLLLPQRLELLAHDDHDADAEGVAADDLGLLELLAHERDGRVGRVVRPDLGGRGRLRRVADVTGDEARARPAGRWWRRPARCARCR